MALFITKKYYSFISEPDQPRCLKCSLRYGDEGDLLIFRQKREECEEEKGEDNYEVTLVVSGRQHGDMKVDGDFL